VILALRTALTIADPSAGRQAIIGSSRSAGFDLNARVAVSPSITGICMSINTASTCSLVAILTCRGTRIVQSTTLTLPHPLSNLAISFVNLIDTFRDNLLLHINKYFKYYYSASARHKEI
jgi:hypothetical protein